MSITSKHKSIIVVFLTVALLIFSSATAAFAASSTEIVKEYEFQSEKVAETYDYKVPEVIKEDNKKYELKDVYYEVVEDNYIEVTKEVTTNNKEIFSKKIEHKLESGETVILTAKEELIQWNEETMQINRTEEYGSREDIPDSIKSTKTTDDGQVIDITLAKANVEETQKNEKFSAPAKFYSPTQDTTKYVFNGEVVTITDEPMWEGYEQDVKQYLGLNGNTYTISQGSWTGSSKYDGTQYVRTAEFSGTKVVPYYVVTYIETKDTASSYTAEVTYEGYGGEATIKAIATYEKAGMSLAQKIAIGAGVAILAGVVVLILYLIAKRKKENENN